MSGTSQAVITAFDDKGKVVSRSLVEIENPKNLVELDFNSRTNAEKEFYFACYRALKLLRTEGVL